MLAPWRLSFIVAGLPGVLFALIAMTLPEIRSAQTRTIPVSVRRGMDFHAIAAALLPRTRAIATHHGATAALAIGLYALLSWGPEMLHRAFGVAPGKGGLLLGFVVLVAGLPGVLIGGRACDMLLARSVAGSRLVIIATAGAAAMPFALALPFTTSLPSCLFEFAGLIFFVSMLTAAGPAGVTDLYPPELRGLGSAIFQFAVTLIGLGIGPTLVPLIAGQLGDQMDLRLSIGVAECAALSAALILGLIGIRDARLSVDDHADGALESV
jgi:MFS family permease